MLKGEEPPAWMDAQDHAKLTSLFAAQGTCFFQSIENMQPLSFKQHGEVPAVAA